MSSRTTLTDVIAQGSVVQTLVLSRCLPTHQLLALARTTVLTITPHSQHVYFRFANVLQK